MCLGFRYRSSGGEEAGAPAKLPRQLFRRSRGAQGRYYRGKLIAWAGQPARGDQASQCTSLWSRYQKGFNLPALMLFHTLSHDTQLQDGGSNTSSGSGEGLLYVCLCRIKSVKGYSCGKLALMEGIAWILIRDKAGRKEYFPLYIPFLPSHVSLFEVFRTEKTIFWKEREASFRQERCVIVNLYSGGCAWDVILSTLPPCSMALCDPWAKPTVR